MSLPRYGEYRATGLSALGELPAHWAVTPLKRMLDIQNGADHKAVESADGVPVIGSGGPFTFASDFLYDGESVLLGRKGTIDRPLHVNGKFWTVDTMYWSRILPDTSGKFAYYAALTIPFDYYSTNTALPSMTKGVLGAHLLAFPPMVEQVGIATFLDRETGKIDALIAEQEKLIALLAEKRQATISHAVTRGLNPNAPMKDSGVAWLGEVPAHWQVKRVRNVATFNPSKSEVSASEDAEVAFFPMEAIGEDRALRIEHTRALSEVQSGYTYFRNGDVVIAKITPCFENGKGALIEGLPGGFGFGTTELIVVRAEADAVRPAYLQLVFSSSSFRKMAEGAMYGAGGQKRVPDAFVRDFTIALPPLQDQQVILDTISTLLKRLETLGLESETAINLLRERRSALIAAAVTGQIDVRQVA